MPSSFLDVALFGPTKRIVEKATSIPRNTRREVFYLGNTMVGFLDNREIATFLRRIPERLPLAYLQLREEPELFTLYSENGVPQFGFEDNPLVQHHCLTAASIEKMLEKQPSESTLLSELANANLTGVPASILDGLGGWKRLDKNPYKRSKFNATTLRDLVNRSVARYVVGKGQLITGYLPQNHLLKKEYRHLEF